jgi:hypothetical protein
MKAAPMKDVTFEIVDIGTRLVREESLTPKGPKVDIAGEKLLITFTVHNQTKDKIRFIPILARKDSFAQVIRDSRGENLEEYNPPHAYICGCLRMRKDQQDVTVEPGEMVQDVVVIETPSSEAKFVRYLLDVASLFPQSKLDAMFSVKIFVKEGKADKKKPTFNLLTKRTPLDPKTALALVKEFVKLGKDKFAEDKFGIRVAGQAKILRIESRDLESGRVITLIHCEVGTEYVKGVKNSFQLTLLNWGPAPVGIANGDTVNYKGAIVGGMSDTEAKDGPEHSVMIALKSINK